MGEIDQDAQAVHLAQDAATEWAESIASSGWCDTRVTIVADHGGVGERVVAVPGQGCGADAQSAVEAEGRHWTRLGDLM